MLSVYFVIIKTQNLVERLNAVKIFISTSLLAFAAAYSTCFNQTEANNLVGYTAYHKTDFQAISGSNPTVVDIGNYIDGSIETIAAEGFTNREIHITINMVIPNPISGYVYQANMQIADLDNKSLGNGVNKVTSYFDIICDFTYNSASPTSAADTPLYSCGIEMLDATQERWYNYVRGNSNASCDTSAWSARQASKFYVDENDITHATCTVQRNFDAAPTKIQSGNMMTWFVGYNVFSSKSQAALGNFYIAQGRSPTMQWVVVDSALALTLSAASAALFAVLAF